MSDSTLLRPLGALERIYYRNTQRNPMHFMMAAEFGTVLDERQVRVALDAMQRRHPLLLAHVEDHTDLGLGFYRASNVAPIPLIVRHDLRREWLSWAAQEFNRTFDDSQAPLMRATLINDQSGSTILLTFEHLASDGMAAIKVVQDLVTALNGQSLPPALPLPSSQEDAIASSWEDAIARITVSNDPVPPVPDVTDPRMNLPGVIRRFDPALLLHIHGVELDVAETARLVERCRSERTTVQAAIVAIASQVRGDERNETFVRTVTAVDLRRHLGAVGDYVDYHFSTRTGLAPRDGRSVWEQARAIRAELTGAMSPAGVAVVSAIMEQFSPADLSTDAAEQILINGLSFETVVSNLGVQRIDKAGPIHPEALWGPLARYQVAGEYVIGIVTYEGRLRMVTCSDTPIEAFQENLRTRLLDACAS